MHSDFQLMIGNIIKVSIFKHSLFHATFFQYFYCLCLFLGRWQFFPSIYDFSVLILLFLLLEYQSKYFRNLEKGLLVKEALRFYRTVCESQASLKFDKVIVLDKISWCRYLQLYFWKKTKSMTKVFQKFPKYSYWFAYLWTRAISIQNGILFNFRGILYFFPFQFCFNKYVETREIKTKKSERLIWW